MIVDGYKDGVMILYAGYLGPAASIGKAIGGGVVAEIANGTYQWFDLNQPSNENWSIGSAAVGAGLGGTFELYAPGFVNSVTGKELPDYIYTVVGSGGSEFIGGFIKDSVNSQSKNNKGGE